MFMLPTGLAQTDLSARTEYCQSPYTRQNLSQIHDRHREVACFKLRLEYPISEMGVLQHSGSYLLKTIAPLSLEIELSQALGGSFLPKSFLNDRLPNDTDCLYRLRHTAAC